MCHNFLLILLIVICTVSKGSLTDPDTPLFLTKFIDNNATEDGRRAAEVMPFLEGVKSYSGLLTVDKSKKSHMFFWYFPAEHKPENASLLIWLNGYSTSSTYGVFLQNGPYEFQEGELNRRAVSWQKWYHIVYIDNPVGVGYSYTETSDGFSKTLKSISSNLLEAVLQFFQLFPDLNEKDLYLCGTSFSGKYIPALAYRIFQRNKNKNHDINLKGLFLGNPFLDPSQISYGEYLYEHGFVDFKEKLGLDQKEKNIQKSLKEGNIEEFYKKVKTYLISNSSYLLNVTGLKTRYDYNNVVLDNKSFKEFIQKSEIKKELHVANLSFNDGVEAMNLLAKPYSFSVKPWLEEMLSAIKMVFYNGQRDISWAYPMMSTVLSSLNWKGADGYRYAARIKLYNGTDLFGYLRSYDNLTDVLILNGGHSAVSNQPQYVLDLLHNLTGFSHSYP